MGENELGSFLSARRAQITPDQVGLPGHGRRRVPGLRREEVAILAGVSPDYYGKLEQGHGAGASQSVLDAIGKVLQLNDVEQEHLRHLAHGAPPKLLRPRTPAATAVRPGLLRLIDSINDVPAIVMGRAFENLASNHLADALFDIQSLERAALSPAQQIFLDPAARRFYPQWDSVAEEVVGYLRFNAGREPNAPELRDLVGELSLKSPEFRHLWGRHTVRDKSFGRKQIRHPVVGLLDLGFETFRLPGDDSKALITYTAEVDSSTADRLQLLASWAASRGEIDSKSDPSPGHAFDSPTIADV